MAASQTFDSFAQSGGFGGVYVVPLAYIDPTADIYFVEGRVVTAIAPHPTVDELVYVTTGHPATLSFLPDEYFETGTPHGGSTR
ncbi:MAG: hypothetical protein JNG88_11950 [Phycisphaerales bacterium]|nr:hypothetical protein [Phycisphaerales bacterium]